MVLGCAHRTTVVVSSTRPDCHRLGEVRGRSEAELRENAASMGADYVALMEATTEQRPVYVPPSTSPRPAYGAGQRWLQGDAFRCSQR
jgi:hypothetical protein